MARTTTSAPREHASLAHRRRWVAASGERRASALRARHLPRALDSAWPAVCQLGRLRLAGAARAQCTAGDALSRAGPVAVAAPAARAAALLASEAEQKYLRRDGVAALGGGVARVWSRRCVSHLAARCAVGDGAGYTPIKRPRTIYNHYHRAFDAVSTITGGDIERTRQLPSYPAVA